MEGALVAGLLVALPMSTAGMEIALGALLVLGLRRWRTAWAAPSGPPALALALVWVLAVPASGDLHEGLGHAWVLAPLLALPGLAVPGWARTAGLASAVLAAAWAVWQRVGGVDGTGGLSHHLTLAYALLPPLAVAVASRRWAVAGALLLGIGATDSSGALPAAVTAMAVAMGAIPSTWGALAGATVTLGLIAGFADPEELRQRAVLWTGGLSLLSGGPVGPGGYAAATVVPYDRLSPGFWFPNHAHDSVIELAAVLGPAGLGAMGWLAWTGLTRAPRGASAAWAGVLVGALTQDVLGDLEVIRAVLVWWVVEAALEAGR